MTFSICGKDFLRDGQPTKIISGAVHYFRNLPETWDDIFDKMVACGLNTVETYTVWNLHEPQPGTFCFDGRLDIGRFLDCAAAHGLMAIVRPGPYICAEWEFGGLPWWLLNDPDMEIRCSCPAYIKRFDAYLDRLFDEIRPHLVTHGGNVIMMQVENEYDSYGDDKEYLTYLRDGYRRRDIDVPLFTSGGLTREDFGIGTVPDCLVTLNFGSRVEERFRDHDLLYPDAPKMCMEMWDGWFDAWGIPSHHTTPAEEYAKTVDDMLARGSLNMYLFIGGTNFGFTSGANEGDTFAPDVTSYDYDALLTEWGDVTPKYMAVRDVIQKYTDRPLPPVPANRKRAALGKVKLTETAALPADLGRLSRPVESLVPRNMEAYGTGYGYVAYQTRITYDYNEWAEIEFESIGDRAQVFLDDTCIGTVYVDGPRKLPLPAVKGQLLTVVCENMGRTNFGPKMMRKKGIAGRCLVGGRIHYHWSVFPLPMEDLSGLRFSPLGDEKSPCRFYRGRFTLPAGRHEDTFLRTDGFKKGFVILNGFNLGRYWEIGPQRALYVPGSVLRDGENEILLFDSDGREGPAEIQFTDQPDLG